MPRGLNRPRGAALAIVVAAMAALVLAPAGASAATCAFTLEDSAGFDWDSTEGALATGSVDDGENDSYDGAFTLGVGPSLYTVAAGSCGAEESGREITYPAVTMNFSGGAFDGLEASRKVFVPATGTPFARWLDILHNPTGAPISTMADSNFNWGHNNAHYPATSSGDQVFTASDRWVTHSNDFSQGPDAVDGPAAWLIDSNPPALDAFDSLSLSMDQGTGSARYLGVTVPAGGTVILMHVAAQRNTDAEALQFAQVYQAGTQELYAGMSMAEISQLLNWPTTPNQADGDLDGVPNVFDNCPAAANANQANLDGDGAGDVCDSDQDGDGLPDSVELAIGSNPRSNNSDGDAKLDGQDACPTKAGTGPDGCPVTSGKKKCKKRTNKQKREGAGKPKKCRKK